MGLDDGVGPKKPFHHLGPDQFFGLNILRFFDAELDPMLDLNPDLNPEPDPNIDPDLTIL
jgi:hypothetical protein